MVKVNTIKKRIYRKKRTMKPKLKQQTKIIRQIVKKEMHKKDETKSASYEFPITAFNSGVNSSGDACRVVPVIQTGTTNGFRISDSISAQYIDIKGHIIINATPNTGTQSNSAYTTTIPPNARLMVRAFICSVKRYANYDDITTNATSWMPDFLKKGSITVPLDGSLQSMYLPVNTDVITVHKEIKKYINIPFQTGITITGSPTIYPGLTTIPVGASVKFFSYRLKCSKILKYDDTNFSPQNYAPIFVLSYCHLDGSSPDVLTTVVSASFVSSIFYEDS